MDFLVGLFLPVLSRMLESTFLAGFATATHLHGSKGKFKPKGVRPLTRLHSTSSDAAKRVHLPKRKSLPKAPPNDPQRQGNIWHRYEQLEGVSKQLAAVNQQIVDERKQYKNDKKRLEDALVELEKQNKELITKLPRSFNIPPLSAESSSVLQSISPEYSRDALPPAAPAQQPQFGHYPQATSAPQMELAKSLSLSLPPLNTHPTPTSALAGNEAALEDLKLLNDNLTARNNALQDEMGQLQNRHRQLLDELEAARSLAETPRGVSSDPSTTRMHEMQSRIHRLEERNRNMIAERARGSFTSQSNSPFGTPRASFMHGSQSPFAMAPAEPNDVGLLRSENKGLHNEVVRLRLELSAARAELQAQEGRMVPSSQGGRFRELEQGVAQGSLDVGALQRRNSDLAGQVDELRQELAAARAESASRQAAPAAPLASAGSVGGGAAGVQELQREKQGLEDEVQQLRQKLATAESAPRQAAPTPGMASAGSMGVNAVRLRELEEEKENLQDEVGELRIELAAARADTASLQAAPTPAMASASSMGVNAARVRELEMQRESLQDEVEELRQELAAARAGPGSRQAAPAPALASAGSMGLNAARVRELEREREGLQDEVEQLRQELAAARTSPASRQGGPAPALAPASSTGINASRVRELEQERSELQDEVDEVRQELALARAALSSRQGAPAPAMASAGSMGVNATRVRELEQEKNNLQDEVEELRQELSAARADPASRQAGAPALATASSGGPRIRELERERQSLQDEVVRLHQELAEAEEQAASRGAPLSSRASNVPRMRELEQERQALQDEVVRLHQELTAARSEVQLHDGGLTATSDQPRVRELEQSVMALQTELASLKAAGAIEAQGSHELPPRPFGSNRAPSSRLPPAAPSGSMKVADRGLVSAGSIGGGTAVSAQAGGMTESEALQAYGNLQVSVSKLTDENTRLQQKLMRVESEASRVAALEDANRKLTQENTRLQSKVLRFDLGMPPTDGPRDASARDQASRALLDELQEENNQLREDNDKLVEYLEKLEAQVQGKPLPSFPAPRPAPVPATRSSGGSPAVAGGGGAGPITALGSVDSFVQLRSRNSELAEENQKLRSAMQNLRGQPGAPAGKGSRDVIPIPVVLDSREELDRDLWVTVEELHAQNTRLLAEIAELKGAPGGAQLARRSIGDAEEGGQASEVERLRRQLAAVMESRAAEINEDNIRLVNQLTEENAGLQADQGRLMRKLSSAPPGSEGEALREALASNERLVADRAQALADCRRLAEKNTRLIEENEALIQRLGTRASAEASPRARGTTAEAAGPKGAKANALLKRFSFARKRDSKLSRDMDDASSTASADRESSFANPDSVGPPEALVNEVMEESGRLAEENRRLSDENRRLTETLATVKDMEAANAVLQEENKRLTEGMALVKELTDENGRQGEEIKRLTDSLNQCLDENKILTSRLIDAALQNDDDLFDAAFADPGDEPEPKPKPARAPKAPAPDPAAAAQMEAEAAQKRREAEAAQKRQEELQAQAREREVQQKADAERRAALTQRASMQLADYEKSKASSAEYKKKTKGAFARLSQFNKQVLDSRNPTQRGGPPVPKPKPPPRPASELPSTPEGDLDFAPRDLDTDRTSGVGLQGLDEALKRRTEAEEAKAELARKIEGLRGKTSEVPDRRRTTSDVLSRREAEQQHDQQSSRKRADEQVRAAYYRFQGNEDVGSFMRALGYPGFTASNLGTNTRDDFRRAIKATAEGITGPPSAQRALAESANARLKEWLSDYNATAM